MQNFTSVPFKTETGLSSVNGVAKFSGAGIVLEFESKLFGIIANGVKEVRLSVAEILDLRFRKGLFKYGAKIEIRTKSFSKLVELPNKDGKLTLKIVRSDFETTQEAVAQLQKDVAGLRQELPPAHTPVSRLFDEDDPRDETKELNNK
ncbi:MAG: hypothetical protein WKF92_11560 [Pyrinomonadaceae bacterium]